MEKISFIGCGSWGGALGKVLSDKGYLVKMWHRDKEIVSSLELTRKHYIIPELVFNKNVSFTYDLDDVINYSSIIIIAIPSQTIRSVLKKIPAIFQGEKTIVNVSKGIEIDTLMTISQIIKDISCDSHNKFVTLSGPSHAEEVIRQYPTTLVSASENERSGKLIQEIFHTQYLRTYFNKDILGVELGGSMKNVIAIAAGICDGIGYGDNSKAALITRGMAEITKLGKKMGAKNETFMGLSGFGDLIVTCLSKHSRNRQIGQAIGEGQDLSYIQSTMNMVAEGVNTAKSVHILNKKYQIEMPIHEGIYNVLFCGNDPKISVEKLMMRKLSIENI